MICVNLARDRTMTDREDEWEAELFALQSLEWMRTCKQKERCPGARFFTHLLAAQERIRRLEHEIKNLREHPRER